MATTLPKRFTAESDAPIIIGGVDYFEPGRNPQESISSMRATIEARLAGLGGGIIELAGSELVQNAKRHGGGWVQAWFGRTALGAVIFVEDSNQEPAVPQEHDDLAESGWGLHYFVSQQGRGNFGQYPTESGKVVWVELFIDGLPPIPAAE